MSAQKPEYWQWRRKSECWDISQIWRHEVFATTDDSEVRQLFAAPPAQRLTDEQIDEIRFNLWNSQPWPQKVLFERAFARAIEAAIVAKD